MHHSNNNITKRIQHQQNIIVCCICLLFKNLFEKYKKKKKKLIFCSKRNIKFLTVYPNEITKKWFNSRIIFQKEVVRNNGWSSKKKQEITVGLHFLIKFLN